MCPGRASVVQSVVHFSCPVTRCSANHLHANDLHCPRIVPKLFMFTASQASVVLFMAFCGSFRVERALGILHRLFHSYNVPFGSGLGTRIGLNSLCFRLRFVVGTRWNAAEQYIRTLWNKVLYV